MIFLTLEFASLFNCTLSHTIQFTVVIITTVVLHQSFTLSLLAQNLPVSLSTNLSHYAHPVV